MEDFDKVEEELVKREVELHIEVKSRGKNM